ncbi:MAG: hypothetical protein ABFR33_09995 [Verrucomicrobiota bacterium]
MDDVFAQLDASSDADAQPAASDVASAEVEDADSAPALGDSEKLSLLFEKGLAQYKAGKYDEAIMAFDAMLAIDKYDSRAVAYRKRAAKRITSKEGKKQGATRAQAVADVNAAWNPDPKVLTSVDVSEDAAADPDQQAIQQMIARLKAINIPSLDFTDASIEDVVLYLTEQSRKHDSSGKGVNILLAGMESAAGDKTVTTLITDINLFDALQVIAETASLKFEVKPQAVAIVPVNYAPVSEMVMKSYDVDPEVGSELESFSGDSGGGVDDLFGDSSASEAATGPVDVGDFFSIIDWPEGSSAIYRPRFHKLFVKNTPKNLKALEEVLDDLDERAIMRRSQQVEIEAKFVEFSEGALEELGFDWNVYGRGGIGDKVMDPRGAAGGTDLNTGQDILIDGIAGDGRPGQNLFGSSQRVGNIENSDGKKGFETVTGGLIGLMDGGPATMMFGNGDVDIVISAMEQEGTADVLTAPTVTTKSGSEAIIRVAETHRYPQDYDVETGQNTSPVVKPQDWEDFDLGVSLRVTPEIDTESNTIDLDLQPEIVEFRAYDYYTVGYNGYKRIGDEEEETKDAELFAKMPYFERRLVQTQVTIADGHTVVMGGLVDERTETFRDQVPFLGDIPYLGRLFRTEGSRSAKINLTIFVKATQVDARGLTRADRELARQ